MRQDHRLSRMLHVLIHLDRHRKHATSDEIAAMLRTNPVVVRRTLGGLRKAGLVTSEKGHGGGWRLARGLADISLRDIYAALGEPPLFAIGNAQDDPDCLVEKAVNSAIDDTLGEAQALMLDRFATVTLADIAADFDRRLLDYPAEAQRFGHVHIEE
ncbi:Rrf2 family transcriptional regulator [Thalassospira mesophila]|uniref:Rrf2 family transcriptional regulator n=1 Tax=Thalassospira mesophila TaxID=1293891 RepID=A0A1Y2L3P5_9PROT|nr:Rrf2 family transcriptional regulator [Thalassospira mesophila]OSQ40456.1 Rrf2 family transcriptional regulator [Thalassospira mesophila]